MLQLVRGWHIEDAVFTCVYRILYRQANWEVGPVRYQLPAVPSPVKPVLLYFGSANRSDRVQRTGGDQRYSLGPNCTEPRTAESGRRWMHEMRSKSRKSAATLAFVVLSGSPRPALAQGPPDKETLAKNPPLFLELARKTLKWDEPAEPAKIVGPIYSVGTKGLSVFLIKTTEGLIIINTAMPGSGP